VDRHEAGVTIGAWAAGVGSQSRVRRVMADMPSSTP
jgi:hypothetical protein